MCVTGRGVVYAPLCSPCDVCLRERREHAVQGCLCACVCLCVCVRLDRGVVVVVGGGCFVEKCSPVQHAGLGPAVSHGAVPPSLPPPPQSLPICIRRRQAEMWQTNLAHTGPAASFYMNLLLLSRRDKKGSQDKARANPPAPRLTIRDLLRSILHLPAGDSPLQECKRGQLRWKRVFTALSFAQEKKKKNSLELRKPPTHFFSLFHKDGNVHLKTSLLYCSCTALRAAVLPPSSYQAADLWRLMHSLALPRRQF